MAGPTAIRLTRSARHARGLSLLLLLLRASGSPKSPSLLLLLLWPQPPKAGGLGGVQNALAHGIPLIIAGVTEDKMEVAARVENTGAGINLRKQRPSVAEIKNAVNCILQNPEFKQKAGEMQADYATKYMYNTMGIKKIAKGSCKQ